MVNSEMVKKVTELQELKHMRDELDATIESVTDEVKAFMGDAESMIVGPYKLTWKTVTSTRLDSKALKKELPEVAERYSVTYETRPFKVT